MRILLTSAAVLLPAFALSPVLEAASIDDGHIQRVLLISVDGMHAADLANFIAAHPTSTLASLSGIGVTYTNASTTSPSDSFPGLAALLTGGLPQDTGLWYDDAWDRGLYQPADTFPTLGGGVTHGPPPLPLTPGIECVLTELLDYDCTRIDAGASLLAAGSVPLNPSYLPRNAGAKPVYPHQIIRVNTIFEVAKAAGKRTAWSDKHAAYEWVNGPSGLGVDDFFVREVNANLEADGATALPFGGPTSSVEACGDYDNRKVAAIVNEINGLDSSGQHAVGVPAIFGMNFQSVSVGQKLSKDGQAQSGGFDPVANPDGINGMPSGKGVVGVVGTRGGYADAHYTPTPVLAYALATVDAALGQMVAALKTQNIYDSTLIVVTAKHGQSPSDITTVRMKHPLTVNGNPPVLDPTDLLNSLTSGTGLPDFTQTDTIAFAWYQDNTSTAGRANVAAGIAAVNGVTGMTVTNGAGTFSSYGIESMITGQTLTSLFDDPTTDPRTPDIIMVPSPGVIYSGSSAKYEEHGGFGPEDTQVVMLLANPRFTATTVTSPVSTVSVAPTVLKSIGLDPNALMAVQREHTPVLAGLGIDGAAPPQAITNLSAVAGTSSNAPAQLSWTAPTSSGPTGAPASYDVRWSRSPITDSTWNSAVHAGASPAAGTAGSSETMEVGGLPQGATVYFAARAMDASGDASPLSNNASVATVGGGSSSSGCDSAPPACCSPAWQGSSSCAGGGRPRPASPGQHSGRRGAGPPATRVGLRIRGLAWQYPAQVRTLAVSSQGWAGKPPVRRPWLSTLTTMTDMTAFSSPPTAEELVQHIDQEALRPIVARAVHTSAIQEMRCHLHRPIQGCKGYSGLTCIISVQYRSGDSLGWVDLLLKWPSAGLGESRLFPLLEQEHAPVPRLEGTLRLERPPAGRTDEVLVFEFLPHIGFGPGDGLALATTLGRFHALPAERFPQLPSASFQADVPAWTDVWQRIQDCAGKGEIGEELRALCGRQRPQWEAFPGFITKAAATADALPRGVVHRDVSPQNCGWRADRRELLLFDVPQMAVGNLARDAQALVPEDRPVDPQVVERYLETLHRHGGPRLTSADLLHAIALVRPLQRIGFYDWALWKCIDGHVDWTDDVEEGKRAYRNGMIESLTRTLQDIAAAT